MMLINSAWLHLMSDTRQLLLLVLGSQWGYKVA